MEESKEVTGYIAGNINEIHSYSLNQGFKGQVNDEPVKFPKELGAAHPFDFEGIEKTVDGIGLVNAGVDKITDSIIGHFTVKVDNENSQTILDDFINNSSFLSITRSWIKEGISKGSGFMDLTDMINNKIQTLNSNNMFVKRTKKGRVIEYNQFIGITKRMTLNKQTVVNFKPNQIAHLKINDNPGAAYGQGLVFSNLRTIENYASGELDKAKLISRKAGAPYHIKVGIPGESTPPSAVDDVDSKLKFMNNRTEWTTDANVEITNLDFKDVGKNLTDSVNHDVEQFAIGMQIPMVLLGVANVAEGLADKQDEGYLRRIEAIRVIVEDILESQVFRPLLRLNNLDEKIEFTWELPGEKEKNERILRINEALKNPFLSPEMKAALEQELAKTMDLQELLLILDTPEQAKTKYKEEQDILRKEEENIKQPEVPGAKPTANQSDKLDIKEKKHKPKPKLVEAIAGKTDKIKDHFHTFGTDDLGNGQTLRTEPVKHEPAHTHIIEEFKVLKADGHTHKLIRNETKQSFTESDLENMSISEYVNITELPGFNYSDYLVKILQKLKTFKFEELLALTEQDLMEGLLPPRDINKLRIILKDGFRKNKTIKQIEKDIAQSIDLKDRVKIDEDGTKKLVLSKELRPNNIARTETVNLANQGLKDLYTENDVLSYRYLAALDERTSDICMSLNGQVFLTKDGIPGVNMPAMHPNCRSTIVGLVE